MKLLELLSQQNVPKKTEGHHHCRSGWVQVDCPKCSPNSKRWRLGFLIDGRRCACWYCGKQDAVKMLAEVARVPLGLAAATLGRLRRPTNEPQTVTGTYRPPKGVGPLNAQHRRYLAKRGYDPDELVERWGIGGLGFDVPRLKNRIFIPFFHKRRPVSWLTRSINPDASLRYVSASEQEEELPHKHLLYGSDLAGHGILVFEGPLDAWRAGPGGVATCGTGVLTSQIALMAKYPIRVICFDNEHLAQRRARELAAALRVFPGQTIVAELESAKDASAADDKEIRELRALIT